MLQLSVHGTSISRGPWHLRTPPGGCLLVLPPCLAAACFLDCTLCVPFNIHYLLPVFKHGLTPALCCVLACAAAFLDRLRIELRLQGQLQQLGLGPGAVQRLLETRIDHDPNALSDLRLDLSPMKHVSWGRAVVSDCAGHC